jgi:O-antigen biosynthesis protein
MPADSSELNAALRRIEQLEAALQRRTEVLEQKSAELSALKASQAYRLANVAQKLGNKFLPLHSRRREWLKVGVKRALAIVRPKHTANGPPPSERHGLETVPFDEYQRWIVKSEPTHAQLMQQRAAQFQRTPVFSILVPVYNPPADYLNAMIRSVREQTYGNWELCLADASTQAHVRPILDAAAQSDSRIKVHYLSENRGIVGNSNAAAQMATGEFFALLDHDDTLAPFALHSLAAAVNAKPDADFLYSDEDKLDPRGRRCEPAFKPDWSPDLLRARNYITHLTVLRRDLFKALEGFRTGYDGAQDYDMVLRAGERARQIVHIPEILYHWRMHPQSTAADAGSKHYAFEAGKRAVEDQLRRNGTAANVFHGPVPGTYKVSYTLSRQPLVSIIIPKKDHPDMLRRAVDAVRAGGYANYEIVIVENGSTKPETFLLYERLQRDESARILTWDKPFNFAAVNNFAARQAAGELLLFLNNDVEAVGGEWLDAMVRQAIQPGVGGVGAMLYYPDDTIQHAGIIVGMGGVAGHAYLGYPRGAAGYLQGLRVVRNVSAAMGACLLCPREAFERVGGYDEGFVLAFNDVDLGVQLLQAGYRMVWTPDAELYHYESKTRGYEDTPEKQRRFRREVELFHAKWGAWLAAGDPCYNRHFRLDRSDYALRAA